MPNLRNRVLAGETVVGSWICTNSPATAEIMAASGFDFLAVDAEHSPVGLSDCHHLFQAIRSGNPGCAAMLRLEGVDYAQIKRYLDAGADGVIAPLVNTAAQARELVRAAKYPPLGGRGLGFCRANNYGVNVARSFAESNDQTLVAVQIEHIDAVSNIDSILSVEGIDAAFIGPFDLSASMGMAGDFEAPAVNEAIAAILAACKRHSISPGIHVVKPDPDEFLRRAKEGFRFMAYSLDITMLTEAARSGLDRIRSNL